MDKWIKLNLEILVKTKDNIVLTVVSNLEKQKQVCQTAKLATGR